VTAGLRLEALRVAFRGRTLATLDVAVAPGRAVAVMGPSGVGKSTLLAAALGALPPGFTATGRVWVDGRDVSALPPEARGLGIMFQNDALFPHLSVGGNLLFALPRAVRGRAARRAACEAALAEVGLQGCFDRDPATLSGGQRTRVALLRALLARPRALLLDEPFGGLDAALRDQVRRLVFGRAREAGLPVLLVTHDAADAEAAGGPVARLTPEAASLSGPLDKSAEPI
jgi:putative thiamine transport system ATP-binding protein